MRKIALIVAAGLVTMIGPTVALAQSNRTFVSGQGSDTGTCGIAAPCRSFAYAVTVTNAGGELAVLDTAGYGAVTITKAISIINQDGVEAGITATSGNGVTVSAGASDVVNLRGLTLVGGGAGNNGITVNTAGTVNIQNCVIRGFTGNGINVPSGAGPFNLNVADTIVSNNGQGAVVRGASGTTNVVFERVQAIGNSTGGMVVGSTGGTLNGTAADSLASNNGVGFGVSSGGPATIFTIFNSKAVENTTGLQSQGTGATMFVAYSTVSGNSTGYSATSSGLIKSGSNNLITDTSNVGSLTPLALQ